MIRLDEACAIEMPASGVKQPLATENGDMGCQSGQLQGMIHAHPEEAAFKGRGYDLSEIELEKIPTMQIPFKVVLNSVIEPERLVLLPTGKANEFDILDLKANVRLGTLIQPENASHEVELFWGKGGFMAVIRSPRGAIYFALPGASVRVGQTVLTLEGLPIVSNPEKPVRTLAKAHPPQRYSTQATILGAGLATRFERISGDSTQYSKPAVPLAGQCSVIEVIANGLVSHGFSRVIVNTFFKPESLKSCLSRCDGAQVSYIDEAQPPGTAGGLRKMLTDSQFMSLLDVNQPLLVVQGDSVTDASFSELMEAHISHGALVTIGCQLVAEKDVDKFGIIVTDQSGMDGQSGRIIGFQEKPKREDAKSLLGNTGFYIFAPAAFPMVKDIYDQLLLKARKEAADAGQPLPDEVPIDFANDIFPAILERTRQKTDLGAFWAQTVEGYWSDIGNPTQYLESVRDVYAGKVNIPLPADVLDYYEEGIVFWEGASRIAKSEGAVLTGNVVVATPFRG